jgi:phospholipase C
LVFAAGELTGTPATPGIYNITVTASDAANAHASRAYTFAVNTADLSISTASPLPDAVAGEAYGLELTASASGPGTWSASGLPPGLSISPAGVISGTPLPNGSVNTVAVKVVHSGVAAFKAFPLTVRDALLFSDPLYAPRGDGNTIWQPPKPPGPAGSLPVPVHPAPATTPGDLAKVDHIVVVMMENRSFDHMLGYLSREGGRADVEGLKWEAGEDRTQFNFYKGRYYYPTLLTDTHAFYTEDMSPDHSHESVKAQMADGMGHFVSDYAKNKVGDDPATLQLVMGYYGAQQLPVYDMLAREFAICDHWFCSHVGPTWPNRFVTLTGDLNRDSYGEPEVNTPLPADFTPSEAATIFDLLTDRGVSWLYFQQRESMMRAFTKYSFDMANVRELYTYDDNNVPLSDNLRDTIQSNGLPSVTFIDPLFGDLPAGVGAPQDNDDAPPSDLQFGQRFIADILANLFTPDRNKDWQKTMLIIVYDEHGGFYDHVQPPANATPLTGQNSGKLGPRVPAFVVSPSTPAGLVLKDTFDHGTIAATILRRFCSPHPPFMSPRVTSALDLRGALPLAAPRKNLSQFLGLPNLVVPPVGATQQMARAEERRFHAPQAPDAHGEFLGGIMMTLGSTPR